MENYHRFGLFLICLFYESVTAVEPTFLNSTNNVTVFEGDNATLPCKIINLTDTYEVTWTKPIGQELTKGENISTSDPRFSLRSDWDLFIKNVSHSDTAIYTCKINTVPPRENNVSLTVLPVEPTFPNITNNVTVFEGENATLPCNIINLTDTYEVTWTKPYGIELTRGNNISTSDTRFSLRSDWDLFIENVSHSDTAIYTCKINSVPPRENNVSLTVLPVSQDDIATIESTTSESTTKDPNTCSDSRPCQNGGNCSDGLCNCTAGYKGRHCEIYDYCESNPCVNGRKCELLSTNDNYTCSCITGDPNNDCKLNDRDDCALRPPSNISTFITCIDKIETYKMYCSPGYDGETNGCQNATNDPDLFCKQRGQGYCRDEGYCKPLCNFEECNGTQNCQFTADPYNTTGFATRKDCIKEFGNGYYHKDCKNETTLFDGFDNIINQLTDCSPFIDTMCTRDFGNGDCKLECNNDDCLYDGFDCSDDNRTFLAGVVVVELKHNLTVPLSSVQKNMSMMLRSEVNLTVETYEYEPAMLLQLKVTKVNFTDIVYVGKFLAAVVAKRPEWMEGITVSDVYVCPAGKYSSMYSDKCHSNCSTCTKTGDICDWKTGKCLDDCQPGYWGQRCTPCHTCVQEGGVCNISGDCLFGCKPGHYGDRCLPCETTCKNEGEVCNNRTGECLHGCINKNFYGPSCLQCPQNCVNGCNELGECNDCVSSRYGKKCEIECDMHCLNSTCNTTTGMCVCTQGKYWDRQQYRCKNCSNGCTSECNVTSGHCECNGGYYGSRCDSPCNRNCLNGICNVNGTCDLGCDMGFYGTMCEKQCPSGCKECSRDAGVCGGQCKQGFEGSNCEKQSGKSGYVDAVTDNTGVIIGVVISLLLVVLIIVVACIYWKKRQSGDYVMEDAENDEPMAKATNATEVHTNTHMQPSTPLLGHSGDMVELDEKQNIAVYAGPGRGASPYVEDDNTNDSNPQSIEPEVEKDMPTRDETDEARDDNTDITANETPEGRKERVMSSVTMEIGVGGRVLSVSDGNEVHSPTLKKEGLVIGEEAESAEAAQDDSAFDEPPHSPLGEVRAPLASEENILASLGPKEMQFDKEDEPADLDQDKENSKEEDEEPKRSRSSSSSSSSSNSSKGSKKEISTEM